MKGAVLVRDSVVSVDANPDVLARIGEPHVHLALWKRSLPDSLDGLATLCWDEIEDVDDAVAVEKLADEVPALVEASGYGDLIQPISREIVALGQQFGAIMGCDVLRLRLEVIETDACRKFHADQVTVRLLMPLVGPGTQWLHSGTDGPIEALRPGDVGLFKGRLLAEEPLILHRSPPIAATGETRLLLAMNPYVKDELE